jgi:hypothetical protein
MKIKNISAIALLAISIAAVLISPCEAARKKLTMSKPDFTKGDPIPHRRTADPDHQG